jgi:hypothetical protein
VLAASHVRLPLERLRARAAADRSPAALLGPDEIEALSGGVLPWRDEEPG